MKKLLVGAFAGIAGLMSVTGCLKKADENNQQTCTYDSCSVKAPAAEIEAVQKYLTDSSLTATQHCSGVFYKIESQGAGQGPTPCSYITVRYKGKLSNGNVFDSTKAGDAYSSYLGNLVRGWVNTVPYLKTGGRMKLYVPPTLAYGSVDRKDLNGNVVIPKNSITIFDIELVAVQ